MTVDIEPGIWSNSRGLTILIREINGGVVLYATGKDHVLKAGEVSWISDAIREGGYHLVWRGPLPGRPAPQPRPQYIDLRPAPTLSMFAIGFLSGCAVVCFALFIVLCLLLTR